MMRAGRRETRVVGATMPNFYRQSFGPGWALVGDAGYVKDATIAQGISDAFADAESLVGALDAALSGTRLFVDALGEHQRLRDERTRPRFDLALEFGSTEAPDDESARLFAAIAADPAASDDFASVIAGTMPPGEFFDPENLGRLLGAAA
jgi:2-polyprenyl-6-methoxyphenol hydroxylase-like FAD-dependent oxidoreductase